MKLIMLIQKSSSEEITVYVFNIVNSSFVKEHLWVWSIFQFPVCDWTHQLKCEYFIAEGALVFGIWCSLRKDSEIRMEILIQLRVRKQP